MGEEYGLRIVECLRGRLLAERLASRNAKKTTEETENKLLELEAQLEEEMKSRKKAEKRLKLLMKRLQTLKISNPFYDMDDSDQSCSFDISEVTCVSSSTSCTSKKTEDRSVITLPTTQDLTKNIKLSSVVSENCKQDVSLSRISLFNKGHEIIRDEVTFSSLGEDNSSVNSHKSKTDYSSLNSSNEDHNDNGKDDEEPKTNRVVHDETVKEGLDSLRHVNQISIEQRRMVRVG